MGQELIEDKIRKMIAEELASRGYDDSCQKDKWQDISVANGMVVLKAGDKSISMPAPSQEATDRIFHDIAMFFAGALAAWFCYSIKSK